MLSNLLSTQDRTKRAVQNIGISLFIKGGSILISFLLIPLTLDYLNPYEYGIWLTLNSVLSWVYLFDIGLGNGLRNRLAEALAKGDNTLGKIYVSTTYFCMTVIISIIYFLFLVAQNWLDWYEILNVEADKVERLNFLVTVLFGFFCLSFVFRLLGNVFMAKQLSAANDAVAFAGNLLSLLVICACTKLFPSSLMLVGCVLAGSPLIVFIIATPFAYSVYKSIAPSVKYIRFDYFRPLLSLGVKFMIIQVATLVLYMSSNLIISHLFGPQEVTPYNIAFKLFSAVSMGFTIIITPFWSAITDAYTKREYSWIEKTVRRICFIWLLLFAGTCVLLFLSPWVYRMWIGDKVEIPFALSALCALYASLINWNNIWAYTINGTGKLFVSLILSGVQAIVYIPLAIILGKYIGVAGIVVSLCISMSISSVIAPVQTRKLLLGSARGIWNK